MWRKLKKAGCIIVIIILLPYVITIFVNGVEIKEEAQANNNYIKVKTGSGKAEISIEEYGLGLLARELPAEYEKEAAKAQAVVVRTSIYKKLIEEGDKAVFEEAFWTVKDMEQQWGRGYSEKYEQLKEVWNATGDDVVTYQDQLALTPFHQLSNGKTRNAKEVFDSDDYPYLVSKECPADIEQEEQLKTSTINWMDCKVNASDSTGYVLSVKCGKEICTGEDFRRTYGLRSSSFTIQDNKDELRITSQGIGHGLGMSQNTANEMAKEGDTYIVILNYFYDKTEIQEVSKFL